MTPRTLRRFDSILPGGRQVQLSALDCHPAPRERFTAEDPAPQSGGSALFDEPSHVEQAAALDQRYRDAKDMEQLSQLWSETIGERRAIIAADSTFKDVFGRVLAREKARLEGADA